MFATRASHPMVSEMSDLRVLHCVVKHSSFARAAKELGITASGVSRIVSRLEERLGVRLLQRTTRQLSLTEAGAMYHERTIQIAQDLAEAEAEVQKTSLSPRGKLKLTASVVFGELHLAQLIDELLVLYPDLSVELHLTNRFVDLVEEGVDLAIRIGKLADSRLVARRLCTNQRVLVASPEYLKEHGTPRTPQELSSHECVLFTGLSRPNEWLLESGKDKKSINVSGRFASNNIEALTVAAKSGRGITVGATLSVGKALLSGELVRVLSDWHFEPTGIHALYPSARQVSSKVRATIDFLATKLGDPPSWDRELAGKVSGF